MVHCGLLVVQPSEIEILLMLGLLPWHLCGWEAKCWTLHILSLSCLCLILPPLTISDSILNGAKYNAQSLLIALRLPDFFLMSEIDEIPLFSMIIDVIL